MITFDALCALPLFAKPTHLIKRSGHAGDKTSTRELASQEPMVGDLPDSE